MQSVRRHDQTGTIVTVSEFRQFALALPGAEQRAHMGHPDFRVGGRVFATLNYPAAGWGMIKLSPEHQELFLRAEPAAFVAVKGAWGRQGCTNVNVRLAKKTAVREALELAWRALAPTPGAKGRGRAKPRSRSRRAA